MAYGKRTYSSYKKTTKAPAKKTYKKSYKPKGVSSVVKKYIKRTIETRLEDKFNADQDIVGAPLLKVTSNGGAYQFFNTVDYGANGLGDVFDIAQGTAQDQRIGNTITLKKWVLRFSFLPNGNAGAFITTPQLYVNFFIGYKKSFLPQTAQLVGLFQNGNSSYSPTGIITDRLAWINKDVYTILYKKVFKVGLSAPVTGVIPAGLANNDFPLIKQFSVDLCKHGFKNFHVKYDDATLTPTNAKILNLQAWCFITNANGITISNALIGTSYYDVTMTNNIQYTDA